MDNLTHSLAGALLGQMGLKTKTGLSMPTLIIAANLPDIDAVAVLLGGHQHLALRRGLTHGPIAMVLLPVFLWAVMLAWDKWRPNEKRLPVHKGWLLALAYIGTISHPALDWLNNYGVRLLEPFSSQWFYGDTIFIIDIWIWAGLITSVWISLRREKRGQGNWQRPAWLGFTAISAYIFANGLITGYAETSAKADFYHVVDGKRVAAGGVTKAVAKPVPVLFWRREVIIKDEGEALAYTGVPFSLFSGFSNGAARDFQIAIDGFPDFKKELSGNPQVDTFLFWSRLPYLEFEERECGVVPCPIDPQAPIKAKLKDARFNEDIVGDRFSVPVILPPLESDKAK